jgi:hypothetical protein
MPFQNAPANGGCGAKISRDDLNVVRYNEKSGENFFNVAGIARIFFINSGRRNRIIPSLLLPFLFCCCQDFEPCISFQRADFYFFKPCIFA